MIIVRSSPLLLVHAFLTLAFAEESSSGNASAGKRGPMMMMGFQGMRGKKDFAPPEPDQQLSKRAPMGFQGMRGKKDSLASRIGNQLVPEDAEKRAAMGFHGIRGKKENLMADSGDSYFSEDYEKRAPMGFHGMRGKKIVPLQEEYYKRAPMGFQGMRGKKSLEQIWEEIEKRGSTTTEAYQEARRRESPYLLDYPENYEKTSLPLEYEGARDKKEERARLLPFGEWKKRAPMGFQGMRGKKAVLDAMEQLEKRAAMGFHGMRGKKDSFDNYADYSIDPSDYRKRAIDFQDSDFLKRAPMGFHGMRGKRGAAARIYATKYGTNGWPRGNQPSAYQIEKRSPFRYLGVRGKKNPRYSQVNTAVNLRSNSNGDNTSHCPIHRPPSHPNVRFS